MKMESARIGATSCFLSMVLLLGGGRAAISQAGSGHATGKLPSIIAKAIETVPFSFVYDGRPSSELLPRWEKTLVTQTLPGNRERRIVTYRDRHTGLEISY
jgi:hypothetical protein